MVDVGAGCCDCLVGEVEVAKYVNSLRRQQVKRAKVSDLSLFQQKTHLRNAKRGTFDRPQREASIGGNPDKALPRQVCKKSRWGGVG
jgi:hypothetical protein